LNALILFQYHYCECKLSRNETSYLYTALRETNLHLCHCSICVPVYMDSSFHFKFTVSASFVPSILHFEPICRPHKVCSQTLTILFFCESIINRFDKTFISVCFQFYIYYMPRVCSTVSTQYVMVQHKWPKSIIA